MKTWFFDAGQALGGTDIPMKIEHNDRDGTYLSCTSKRFRFLEKRWKSKSVNVHEQVVVWDELSCATRGTTTRITGQVFRTVSDQKVVLLEQLRSLSKSVYLAHLQEIYVEFQDELPAVAEDVANIDLCIATGQSSIANRYTAPSIHSDDTGWFKAKELRHPISELSDLGTVFVPHNISLGLPTILDNSNVIGDDNQGDKLQGDKMQGMMLNSPNASGKSILLKSVGIAILMAQIGWHVPCSSFELSPYHYLGCRAGHVDDVVKGESTFTVEMKELRHIMNNCSAKSFCMLDEIAASTEYPSAMAIQVALVQHLVKAKTSFLFATHIHKLHEQAEMLSVEDTVKFYHLYVENNPQLGLVYHRTLKPGALDRLYGLEVANNIIENEEFNTLAMCVRNRNTNNNSLDEITKVSRYNGNKIVYKCEICGKVPSGEETLDTHHIDFQCNADEHGFIGHMNKDIKGNLISLCKEHHKACHNDTLIIHGYMKTSKGVKLDYEFVDPNKPDNSDSGQPKKKTANTRKKYNEEQIELVCQLRNCSSKAVARRILKTKHEINISAATIQSMWNGKY